MSGGQAGIPGGANLVNAAPSEAKAVFITPQALVTFPVATFVVGLIWKVIGTLWPVAQGSLLTPLVLSMVLGAFIWWVGITDPQANMTPREKIIAAFVGVVNAFYLFASVVGIVGAVT